MNPMSTTPTTYRISERPVEFVKGRTWAYIGDPKHWWLIANAGQALWFVPTVFWCHADERPTHDPTVTAPPLSPSAPTDEAKLREVIEKALRKSENQFDNIEERTDRILAALGPHLSQREPGDSELLKECRELRVMLYATSTGMRGYHDDGELQDNREHPFIDFKRDSVAEIQRKNLERNVRHLSAQRGEGKP